MWSTPKGRKGGRGAPSLAGCDRKKNLERAAAFAPVLALLAAAYAVPLGSNLMKSLQNEAGEYVGLANYAEVLSSYYFLDSLWFTLKLALLTTLAAVGIAVAAALALRETFVGKKLVLFLFQYNLCVPHMAVAMMMVMLLSQTGVLSSAAYALGLTDGAGDFPWLVRDSRGVGIALTFIWKYFPYIGLSALGVLQGASLEYEQQAAVLGVGRWRRFFHVLLPRILPAVSFAMIVVFAAAFGEYEIPAILGSGAHKTLSVMVYMKYCDLSTRSLPQAYAMMVMLSLALMTVILAFYALTAGGRRRGHEAV